MPTASPLSLPPSRSWRSRWRTASPAGARMGSDALSVDVRVGDRLQVAFTAAPGFTVLFGPSGAGKTTTLLAVAGLLDDVHGSIRLGAIPLLEGKVRVPPEHRHVGLVFQSLALFPHMSARENVAYGIRGDDR